MTTGPGAPDGDAAFDARLRSGLAGAARAWAPAEPGGAGPALLDAVRRRSRRRRQAAVAGASLVAVLAVAGAAAVGGSRPRTGAAGSAVRTAPACVRMVLGAGPAVCAGTLTAADGHTAGTAAGARAGAEEGVVAQSAQRLPGAPTPSATSAAAAGLGSPRAGTASPASGNGVEFGQAAAASSGAMPVSDVRVGEGQEVVVRLPALAGMVWAVPSAGPVASTSGAGGSGLRGVVRVVSVTRDRATGAVRVGVLGVGPGTVLLQATARSACAAATGCGPARWRWTVTVWVSAGAARSG